MMDKRAFLKMLGTFSIAAPTAAVTSAMMQKGAGKPEAKTSAYDRVMRAGTIRCGYTPYSVGLMKDPNTGALSGIYYDIITRLASNLSLKVVWTEEVGWSGQIEGLETNRYDLIGSPSALNSGRARSADFSIPLYYSPVHIWVRANDMSLKYDLKALDSPKVKISTLDGEQTSVFARQYFPKAQQVALPQLTPFSDLMLQVTTGKADMVFAEPASVKEFMRNNPNTLRQLTPDDKPLLVVPNIILLPRGEYAFKEMIDNALREMFNSRLIDMFIDKYEPFPNSYVRESDRR